MDRNLHQNQHEQFEKEGGHEPFEQDAQFESRLKRTDEEFAADWAPAVTQRTVLPHRDREVEQDREEDAARGAMLGWIALILGIAALFVWQPVLGPASIITGIFAWARGSRTLGGWGIALGVVALAAYFVLVPYYS